MTSNAEFWDNIAEKYAAQPVADVGAFERKKTVTREHLTPGAKVLEIGCGTGTLALEMAPFAGHIHAMDISAEMLRIANQKKRSQAVANVAFCQGTLDGPLPFEPNHFDSAWAYSILHLVPNRRKTVAAIFELLRPGGTFISSNVCLADSWIPYRPLLAIMRRLGKAPPVALYGRRTLLDELNVAGFVSIQELDVGAGKQIAFVVARKPPSTKAS